MFNKIGFSSVTGNVQINKPINKIKIEPSFPLDIIKGDAVSAKASDIIADSNHQRFLVLDTLIEKNTKNLEVI
ncbi:MAG: hypothetical protein WCG23_09835 [bacterium]